jgi:hypothetical protein
MALDERSERLEIATLISTRGDWPSGGENIRHNGLAR